MNTFSALNLNAQIFKSIDACGYKQPTEIQAKTIPLILNGQDVIGATETGSGKTAAFVLPMLHMLAESKKQQLPRILILTPTRELADQITQAIRKYGQLIRPNTASIIGGASYREQERMLSRSPDIIVATPGRLIDHLRNNRINLSAIEMFILDEADRMLDMGFIDDVKLIAKSTPAKKQTLLFTATMNKKLISSVGYLLNNPTVVDLSKPKMIPTQIKQQLFIANSQQQKITFLENLLVGESVFKGIIFTATKMGADKIADHLRSQGHSALALHGDLKQRVRKKSLERFSEGSTQYLVATDIASRGIDVKDISYVINYDLPRCSDDYIHRVGRTGRAGKPGVAVTIATRDERRHISSLERDVGSKLDVIDQNREPSTEVYIEEPRSTDRKRSGRSYGQGGNFRGGKSFGSNDRGSREGRSFNSDDRRGRSSSSDERSPRGGRSFSSDERGPRGPRSSSSDERSPRGGRSFSSDERGPRGPRTSNSDGRTAKPRKSLTLGDRSSDRADKPFTKGPRKTRPSKPGGYAHRS
ncbi:MAG: DEAD/DEAH box helicase [Gammaproteobacteria bacterium]|nr:DEAD/DEAH box helicase [Gammaproteobacteria bacterium]